MKIDAFSHFLPLPYFEALKKHAPQHPVVTFSQTLRPLWDIEERLRMLAPYPDLKQIVTLGLPPPELCAGPDLTPELARIANDGMAAIRDRTPERFPDFVASLPMNNIPAALEEMDRAVGKLGAIGIQVLTSVGGKPLDHAELFPVFERITMKYKLPVWMHPFLLPTVPDYPTETHSDYDISLVLNWPHESSVAMARIVFSEMFDRLPGLRVMTHHCGATIPYLEGRVGPLFDQLGERERSDRLKAIRARMNAKGLRPVDYFKKFYGDTALGGATPALACGIKFFGANQVFFATDFPYGPELGALFLRENMRSVDEVEISQQERDGIYFGNALKLLRKQNA